MSRLVGYAGSLALSVVLVFAASEWLVQKYVLPQDTLRAHLQLLAHADAPSAAFGDSHVARGFDAPIGFVNLAFPSEGIEDFVPKAQTYFDTRAPQLVIVQADPHQFSPYRLNARRKTYTASGSNPAIADPRHRGRLLKYWDAFFRDGGTLQSKVQITENGALLSQGDFSQVPPRRQTLEAAERLRTHRIGTEDAVRRAQATYSGLLDTLAAKGAQVCLVTFPVTAAYRAAENGTHALLIDYFTQEANRIGAAYIDARAMVRDTNLFRDVDHLNVEGARQFADRLIAACRQ